MFKYHHANMMQLFVKPFDNRIHRCFQFTNFLRAVFLFNIVKYIVSNQLNVMKLLWLFWHGFQQIAFRLLLIYKQPVFERKYNVVWQ